MKAVVGSYLLFADHVPALERRRAGRLKVHQEWKLVRIRGKRPGVRVLPTDDILAAPRGKRATVAGRPLDRFAFAQNLQVGGDVSTIPTPDGLVAVDSSRSRIGGLRASATGHRYGRTEPLEPSRRRRMHNLYREIDPPTPQDYRGVNYLPLPHVIRERTAEIRAGWSEQERRKREMDAMYPRGSDSRQHASATETMSDHPARRDRSRSANQPRGT